MARVISNISEISNINSIQNTKVLSFSEELQKLNKIKYNLSLAYFAGLVVIMTTLFL
jgi:hypothetical protein